MTTNDIPANRNIYVSIVGALDPVFACPEFRIAFQPSLQTRDHALSIVGMHSPTHQFLG